MSREIDALVAEHVMGWRLIRTTRPTYGGDVTTAKWYDAGTPDPNARGYFGFTNAQEYPMPRAEKWSPSTDIGDAWRVVEKMREHGWHIVVETIDDDDNGYDCEVWHDPHNTSFWEKRADEHATTAPMAIALAALKAHGITLPGAA